MPPIDLPPETPQDAIRCDLLRPRISFSVAPAPSGLIYSERQLESAKRAHHGERPHGGEPTVRVIRDATGFASTSTSEVLTTVIHEPWRDSASTFIVQGIILNQKTPAPLIFWRRS